MMMMTIHHQVSLPSSIIYNNSLLLFIIILLLLNSSFNNNNNNIGLLIGVVNGYSTTTNTDSIPCNVSTDTDDDDDDLFCSVVVGKGSICLSDINVCSNNQFAKGCLYSLLPGWDKLRVCNSEDPPNAASEGLCQEPELELNYLEIRIAAQNWESAVLESWLMQIVLSELLYVPSTIEGQTYESQLNFYDYTSKFEYGYVFDEWNDLENSQKYKDCRNIQGKKNSNEYESCAHFVTEMWSEQERMNFLLNEGAIEPPQGMGLLGWETWFIPKMTAQNDPSLLSYFGLYGEENRIKLASKFPRPTSWGNYCELISENNCTTPDNVAKRQPIDDWERSRYFDDYGDYIGYFRNTTQNDCNLNPNNCTGHFADYPCGWGSYFQQQSHHLNIALESNGDEPGSGGYTYTQSQDIWKAANATRSNVMMMWWTPELLVQQFAGTDYEFQRVLLPFTTQQCVDARVPLEDVCSDDVSKRYGSPDGACEQPPTPLYKVISSSVLDWTYDDTITEATKSPAHEALELFRILDPQMGSMFDKLATGTPREAICEWVVDNLDFVRGFVPHTYPRTIQEGNSNRKTGLSYSSYVLAGVATAVVLLTAGIVFRQRNRRVMQYAQVEFLYLLLFGLLLISLAAILVSVPPTDGTCVGSFWLINLGYTIELVPLLAKVATINRLAGAARKMRRVRVPRSSLFGVVGIICTCVFVFLLVGTIIDPPQKLSEHDLTDTETEDGDTIVNVNYYCGSESDFWRYTSVAWVVLLLICAIVLAVQARNLVEEFNESQTLAIMIYSHFFFLVLRLITFFLGNVVSRSTLALYESLIYSIDVVATIAIYFVPKIFINQNDSGRRNSSFQDSLSNFFVQNGTAGEKVSSGDSGRKSGGSGKKADEAPIVNVSSGDMLSQEPDSGEISLVMPDDVVDITSNDSNQDQEQPLKS